MKREHELCNWCDEVILKDERTMRGLNFVQHWECGMRSIIGGVNHLKRTCTCCGGTDAPDPPGISKREAARLAVEVWQGRYGSDAC